MRDTLEFETLERPPAAQYFPLAGMPIRCARIFDIGEPSRGRPMQYLFRLDVMVKGQPCSFCAGWSQPANEPDPDPTKMLDAFLRLGAYTMKRIEENNDG
jgi:hypothetical protein